MQKINILIYTVAISMSNQIVLDYELPKKQDTQYAENLASKRFHIFQSSR